MTFYFAVSSTEHSIFQANSPTSESIRSALSAIQFPNSQWVGPTPRITRSTALARFDTTFIWPLAVDGPYTAEGALAQAQHDAGYVNGALSPTASGWDAVVVTPYNEAVYGPISAWESGKTAVTQTQNEPMGVLGNVLASQENPYGPSSASTSPPTPSELVSNLLASPTKLLESTGVKIAGAVLVGGVVLFLAWPLISGARSAAAPRSGKRNPRRRRSR